jgi:hypothetical protein
MLIVLETSMRAYKKGFKFFIRGERWRVAGSPEFVKKYYLQLRHDIFAVILSVEQL